ncbi:hypothetical protein RFEPED_0223 [Rickettsia felis str. Pedreira]|uniref:25S rRNA (uridine-N(3))-methyltransferase BMT5-like domain-containing protein n=2 Tax=Rickettsia felis TaxID=42862 RepID=A0A0F3MQB7_RICFI|nr:class I SAM-dependent methyltransferase [Rickettsia felis]AAY61447.1 unknown [Rickettsia felis URRWXCal2]KHO02891.1 hypothetical protein JS55_03450 [Rickettsia felis str. LSU]KHO03535.1 hypothetical protein JS61_03370 [Rickettsia felis]KJV57856.1 hypothetical protein RFEPED_0223 [Rickettsia felis str. Pedreira]MDE8611490.1 class I SAM-dependent methyltransferase [Rickettsia felis]
MINKEDFDCAFKILELQTNILNLKLQQVKLGYYRRSTTLKVLDSKLLTLLKSITKYNFIPRINLGNSLLVGEGNLSFSVSLMKKLQQLPRCITSTYEDYDDLSETAQLNTYKLRKFGINVLHNIDATKLHKNFNHNSFDTIIFQFPHSGSREEINGLNPNYILVRDFIVSASYVLKKHGLILITIVDSDFYNSIFQFEKLSQELKISTPIKYKFDPKDYPEYVHTMTNQDESAIENYSKFATWEFKL